MNYLIPNLVILYFSKHELQTHINSDPIGVPLLLSHVHEDPLPSRPHHPGVRGQSVVHEVVLAVVHVVTRRASLEARPPEGGRVAGCAAKRLQKKKMCSVFVYVCLVTVRTSSRQANYLIRTYNTIRVVEIVCISVIYTEYYLWSRPSSVAGSQTAKGETHEHSSTSFRSETTPTP